MGLGSTAKKLQKVADMAEDVYRRLNELREQVVEMRETVEETERRTDRLDVELAEQRELLDALAADAGLDVDEVVARAHVDDAEGTHVDQEPRPDADGVATGESTGATGENTGATAEDTTDDASRTDGGSSAPTE